MESFESELLADVSEDNKHQGLGSRILKKLNGPTDEELRADVLAHGARKPGLLYPGRFLVEPHSYAHVDTGLSLSDAYAAMDQLAQLDDATVAIPRAIVS